MLYTYLVSAQLHIGRFRVEARMITEITDTRREREEGYERVNIFIDKETMDRIRIEKAKTRRSLKEIINRTLREGFGIVEPSHSASA